MTLLSRPVRLTAVRDPLGLRGAIENVEGLARKLVNDHRRGRGANLSATQQEDMTDFLVEQAVALTHRYNPDLTKATFPDYAAYIMGRRIASWYRKSSDDTRYHTAPADVCASCGLARGKWDKEACRQGRQHVARTWDRCCLRCGLPQGEWASTRCSPLVFEEPDEQIPKESDDMASVLSRINRDTLTPEGQRTLDQILVPIVLIGSTLQELAEHYASTPRELARKLKRLSDELEPAPATQAA